MGEISEILEEITTEQIETHIKNLVGIRHPVFAPEALEGAADYILDQLKSLGYQTRSHHFSEDDKQYRTVGRPLLQKNETPPAELQRLHPLKKCAIIGLRCWYIREPDDKPHFINSELVYP